MAAEHIEAAERAVCARIEEQAGTDGLAAGATEAVKNLAHAVSELKYGPFGGEYGYAGSYFYHQFHHREAGFPAGFASDDDEGNGAAGG